MKNTIILTSLLAAAFSNAATITWSSVQTITGDTSEIIDSGEDSSINNVTIFDLNGYSSTTSPVSDLTTAGSDLTTVSGSFTSADYASALDSFDYDFVDILSSGLVAGETYYIQFFYMDERHAAYDNRTMTLGDGNGNEATLNSDGEYVIGQFTADGTSQALTIEGGYTYNSDPLEAHLNMIVFSTTATTAPGIGTNENQGTNVPEPSTILLSGLAGVALLGRRKR